MIVEPEVIDPADDETPPLGREAERGRFWVRGSGRAGEPVAEGVQGVGEDGGAEDERLGSTAHQ